MSAHVVHGEVIGPKPEWLLPPRERAKKRDVFVREFERQFQDWTEVAKVCIDVDKDRDWELLGFRSFEAWILDAAPCSRSYLYLVIGRYKELSVDISPEELSEIPLGSAGVLKQLSSKIRRDPKVRKAAKRKPKEFLAEMQQSHPEQMLESIVVKKLKFTASAWTVIEAAYDAYLLVDPDASLETFFEWLVSEQAA